MNVEKVLTAPRFPESHRKRSARPFYWSGYFGEGRRRSNVTPRFMNERSGLSLLFAVLLDASAGWRGIQISPLVRQQFGALRARSNGKPTIRTAA